MPKHVWTIGHSTRSWDKFLGLLVGHGIEALADVRRFPVSRKYPHFCRDAMTKALAEAGIQYVHFPDLGGRRPPRPDSPNTAWRNASFRGYADYMSTAPFQAAFQRLVALTSGKKTVLMCAEALWWRCHRGLVSDALKASGVTVLHIADEGAPREHPYTGAARMVDGQLSYAGPRGKNGL